MYQDLHSHTYYSFCGKDAPEAVVEAAIAGGLELFGITDHNYGIGYSRLDVFRHPAAPDFRGSCERTLRRYFDHINLIREKYADRIRVLRGIELCTLQDGSHTCFCLPDSADISFFDYCLIENLDSPSSVTGGDLFSYAARCGTPWVGVAHTDLFAHIAARGESPLSYFSRMAANRIFWEMNVSYDSIHNFRVHPICLPSSIAPNSRKSCAPPASASASASTATASRTTSPTASVTSAPASPPSASVCPLKSKSRGKETRMRGCEDARMRWGLLERSPQTPKNFSPLFILTEVGALCHTESLSQS